MERVKRALQPYAVAALAAVTLNARHRIQAAMWRSKRNVLLVGGAGVFLYGVGSATPGALVALLARDNEKHSTEDGVSRESSPAPSTTEVLKQGAARVLEGGKVAIHKAKALWTSADEWISEKDEAEPAAEPPAGGASISSEIPASIASVWQRIRDTVSPPAPPQDHSVLTEQSADPFEGMDEAWNSSSEADDVPEAGR